MKTNLNYCLFTVLLAVISFNSVQAQVNVVVNEVAKFHLVDAGFGLNHSYRNEYELLLVDGKWKTYQTREVYHRVNGKARDRKHLIEDKDTTMNRFVRDVPPDSVSLFLQGLSVIKPKFNPASLNISIPKLTAKVDSDLKEPDPKRVLLFNSFFNTPQKLYRLLDSMQSDSWTDDSPYDAIQIIKKNNDTINVFTRQQIQYMLPWEINNKPTYDLGINHFFTIATGLNNHRMNGNWLAQSVRQNVQYRYANDAFERLRMQEVSPENFKYLQQHFYLVKLQRWNNYTGFTIQPKKLGPHVNITGELNIASKKQLEALTRFAEDTVRQLLQKGGFMYDSCENKAGCTINFRNDTGQSNHRYFSVKKDETDKYMAKYAADQIWPFSITVAHNDRIQDDWIALPDNTFLLTAYIDNYAVGVPSNLIVKHDKKRRWYVIMLFSRKGQPLHTE